MLFVGIVWTAYWNFPEWISDSRYYLAWSYRYLGMPESQAADLVRSYLFDIDGNRRCGFCWTPGWQWGLFHGEGGAVTGPRLVYPLLSAPFVKFFGPPGMLVVPLVSYAVAVVALVVLTARLLGRNWAFAAGVLILLPIVATRYATFAMTETPAMMFLVLSLLFLPLRRSTRARDVGWFSLLLALCLFTRQFAITVPGGIVLAWLVVAVRDRRARNPWLPFAVASTALTGVLFWLQGYISVHFLAGTTLSPVVRYQQMTAKYFHNDGIGTIPDVIKHQMVVDFDRVTQNDAVVPVLVVIAFGAALWRFRSELSALLVGMSVITGALSVSIVEPTYFRYFVPLVPLMVLTTLALLADLLGHPRRSPSRSTEGPAGEAVPSADSPPRPLPAGAPAAVGGRSWQPPWVVWSIALLAYGIVLFVLDHRGVHLRYVAVLALPVIAAGVVALVTRRLGAVAGAWVGLAFAVSATVIARAATANREALALAAVVGALAALPGGPFAATRFRGWSVGAFGILLGTALLITPRAIALAVGVGLVWLLTLLRDRSWSNPWRPYGLVAVLLGGLVLLLDLTEVWRDAPYRGSWLARHPEKLLTATPRILRSEMLSLAHDQAVFAALLCTLLAIVLCWRLEWAWLTAGMLVTGGLLLLLDGRADQFRNFLLAYPAMLLLLAQAWVNLLGTGRPLGATAAPGPWRIPDEQVAAEPMPTPRSAAPSTA